jgi:hypothetical protein
LLPASATEFLAGMPGELRLRNIFLDVIAARVLVDDDVVAATRVISPQRVSGTLVLREPLRERVESMFLEGVHNPVNIMVGCI